MSPVQITSEFISSNYLPSIECLKLLSADTSKTESVLSMLTMAIHGTSSPPKNKTMSCFSQRPQPTTRLHKPKFLNSAYKNVGYHFQPYLSTTFPTLPKPHSYWL